MPLSKVTQEEMWLSFQVFSVWCLNQLVYCKQKLIHSFLQLVLILALGKYHARDIHTWEGGNCDFHGMKVCSCGNCKGDSIECEGMDYHSKNPLTCPIHALAYEVECYNRASQAPQIIHTELGRGHSNYPEAITLF